LWAFFFVFSVVYLLACSIDGFISLGEAIGFVIIYVVFLAVRVEERGGAAAPRSDAAAPALLPPDLA